MTCIFGFMLSHFLKIKTFAITWSLGIAFILLLHSWLWQILVTYAVSLCITNSFKSFSFVVSFTPHNSLFKLTLWSSPFYKWEHLNGLEIFKYIYSLENFNVLPEIAQLANGKAEFKLRSVAHVKGELKTFCLVEIFEVEGRGSQLISETGFGNWGWNSGSGASIIEDQADRSCGMLIFSLLSLREGGRRKTLI